MKSFLGALEDAVEGGNSMGHHSLVVLVCKEYGQEILSWDDTLALLQENGSALEECSDCGWVVEDILDDEGRCSDCSKYAD